MNAPTPNQEEKTLDQQIAGVTETLSTYQKRVLLRTGKVMRLQGSSSVVAKGIDLTLDLAEGIAGGAR
jgi:hypothetical protein